MSRQRSTKPTTVCRPARKPDALIVGDVHVRDDQPKCRTDDFWETQIMKFRYLKDLWQKHYQPAILQPGDLFERWKSSPQVISTVLYELPPMITISGNPGQHNKSPHDFVKDALNVVNLANQGWRVLEKNDKIEVELCVGNGFPVRNFSVQHLYWGEEPFPATAKMRGPHVLITHRDLTDGPSMYGAENALDFLKTCKGLGYDLVVTGHNHKPFVFNYEGALLVNPGSCTRQAADETHEPAVYLWWALENCIQRVVIPHDPGAVTRIHIEKQEIKNERLDAFLELLNTEENEIELTVKFKVNARRYIAANKDKLRRGVVERMMWAIGDTDE